MSQRATSRHPLFDPASTYSRMRKSVRPEYKMRGYIHWLKARAIRLGLPLPERGERQRAAALELAALDWKDLQDLQVTDAILVLPVCRLRGSLVHRRGVGWLVLVREADAARTVGLWVRLDEMESTPPLSCRAFLIEPEVLARLQELVQKVCAVGPDKALDHAFAPDTIASHLDIARLLSAIPDLDGEVQGNEIRFRRLPLAPEFETFPPRQGDLTVVLVFDDPAE